MKDSTDKNSDTEAIEAIKCLATNSEPQTAVTNAKEHLSSSASEGEDKSVDTSSTQNSPYAEETRRCVARLPPRAVSLLKGWIFSPEHVNHPYPTPVEKERLAKEAGISVRQLNNFMSNVRKRIWAPMWRNKRAGQSSDMSSSGMFKRDRPAEGNSIPTAALAPMEPVHGINAHENGFRLGEQGSQVPSFMYPTGTNSGMVLAPGMPVYHPTYQLQPPSHLPKKQRNETTSAMHPQGVSTGTATVSARPMTDSIPYASPQMAPGYGIPMMNPGTWNGFGGGSGVPPSVMMVPMPYTGQVQGAPGPYAMMPNGNVPNCNASYGMVPAPGWNMPAMYVPTGGTSNFSGLVTARPVTTPALPATPNR